MSLLRLVGRHNKQLASRLVRSARTLTLRSLFSTTSDWSGSLSFAGAESDFCSGAVQREEAEWSHSLHFASPESDFCYGSLQQHDAEWSETLSFASAEADFYSATLQTKTDDDKLPQWSETLSFASPEADYTSAERLDRIEKEEWSEKLSFATPEEDYTFQNDKPVLEYNKHDYIHHVEKDECLRDSMVEAYSFASPESDFGSLAVQEAADDLVKQQLQVEAELPLPTSLYEALGDVHDERAIVVTKPRAPFEVVAVNDAWVGLCGYSKEEARDETLGNLLQGPETSEDAVKHLVQELLHGNQASTVLTNYRKNGEKFHNRVKVGPIRDEKTLQITHFVGVLQQVQEAPDHFSYKKQTGSA